MLPAPATPVAHSANKIENFKINFWRGRSQDGAFWQSCQDGLAGNGRYYSHVMMAAWDTDNGQWIGPAPEMEGGGGPIPPPLPPPARPPAAVLLPDLP